MLADEKFKETARGADHLSDRQKILLVDFIRDNHLGEKVFNQEKPDLTKTLAWDKVWAYAKEIGIEKNNNPCKNVKSLMGVFRSWRYKLNRHKKDIALSGNGTVKPLSEVDQRFKDLLDTVNGIAKGYKVNYSKTKHH